MKSFVFLADCANGDIGFCNCRSCSENEGDCDSHNECQDGLACGSSNCPASLGFDSDIDCCYQPSVGDEHFCTTTNQCEQDEGDCDGHEDCQDGLACGSNNCPASLGFDSEFDCCTLAISSPNFPDSYPSNAEETWLLTAPTGSIITVKFLSFHVRISVKSKYRTTNEYKILIMYLHIVLQTEKFYDFLVIYDGSNDQSTQIAKLSGNLGGFQISSTGNSLFVKFKSDSSLNLVGFLATIHYSNPYLNIK